MNAAPGARYEQHDVSSFRDGLDDRVPGRTIPSGNVLAAYVHPGSVVQHSFVNSLNAVAYWDQTHEQRLSQRRLEMRCGTGGLVEARNGIFRAWLDGDEEWLWMVDTDMGFSASTVDNLLAAADPVERPVVGALTFGLKHGDSDGFGGYVTRPFPVMYVWGEGPDGNHGFKPVVDYPDSTVIQIAGTGAACLLVHRSVAEKLRAEHGDTWFEPVRYPDGRVLSEDLAFCYRLLRNEIPLFVHTGVKTTHAKQIWLCEADYLAHQALAEAVKAAGPAVPEGVKVFAPEPLSVPLKVDVAASVESLRREDHVRPDGMLKTEEDLDRYAHTIAATQPEVIVETGSHKGKSAKWFLDTMHAADPSRMHEVISIDIEQRNESWTYTDRGCVTFIEGDSGSLFMAETVRDIVAGRRCMVVLDSDHSAAHVAREIELYGPLVTAGCYLVVEDTIFAYAPAELTARHLPGQIGTPLDAVRRLLLDAPEWERAEAVEALHSVTHHPAGWWVRRD